MLAKRRLTQLARHRELIVWEAGLHRLEIGLECAVLRARLVRIQAARAPWRLAGAAVAGLLAVRRRGGLLRWVPAGITALRWLKKPGGR